MRIGTRACLFASTSVEAAVRVLRRFGRASHASVAEQDIVVCEVKSRWADSSEGGRNLLTVQNSSEYYHSIKDFTLSLQLVQDLRTCYRLLQAVLRQPP